MTTHCKDCGSRMCNHGNCPECRPCRHCDGGDRHDKYFRENERGWNDDGSGFEYIGGRAED